MIILFILLFTGIRCDAQITFSSGLQFSSFNTVGGGRDFSNFVDLPSQRLQLATGQSASNKLAADPNCALVLPGYEYCITYSDIDIAFSQATEALQARLRYRPTENLSTEEVGELGTVIQETSRLLATKYGLPAITLFDSLSLIDTSRTLIGNYCPANLQKKSCELTRYRDISGTCNNLENPLWGSSSMAFSRFLPYAYSDGVSAPRAASSGRELPSARSVSAGVHRDEKVHEHSISLLLVAWGQLVDHDITLTAETSNVKCCTGPNVTHPNCLPIEIPSGDHFYAQHNQGCMNFVRSRAGLRSNCKLGPREQFNQVSSTIDANPVYSNDEETLRKLRLYSGGQMKSLPAFRDLGLKDLLPLNLENPDEGCIRPNKDVFCFLTGDPRASEQTVLSVLHTLLLREHNRIAGELERLNPSWTDETLFQETRHIIAAMQQHITFNEFLPLVLGKIGLHKFKLTPYTKGYYDGYDESINPSAASAFTTAAFRFGHSLLPSTIERWSMSHQYIGNQPLSQMLQQPYDLFKAGWADQYMVGLMNQVAQAMDDSVTDQVTNHLFENPGSRFGMDLAAINMQRGRDHGLPGYNRYREWCGLKPLLSWDDLHGVMRNATTSMYPQIYESPEDIDLWSGGLSELPEAGALVGPTFACIIGNQFSNLRAGDRYWYENAGWPSSFTLEQLEAIRQTSLARLICDNADTVQSVQLRAMLLPDHKLNPRLPCGTGELPSLDLSYWRDAHNF